MSFSVVALPEPETLSFSSLGTVSVKVIGAEGLRLKPDFVRMVSFLPEVSVLMRGRMLSSAVTVRPGVSPWRMVRLPMPESDDVGHRADFAFLGRGLARAGHSFLEDAEAIRSPPGSGRGEHHELEREAKHATPPSGRTGGCEEDEGLAADCAGEGHSSGIFPATTSFSHCSCSGQETAQVPKSAMCWYFVSRSMAFCRILGSFRKTGPWLGRRYSASSSRMRFKRLDEAGQVRAVVGVDRADAPVLVDVVAAEEQVAELEAELPRRVAGRVPHLELELADLDLVALVELHVDLAGRHRDVEVLRGDAGVRLDGLAGLQERPQRGGGHAVLARMRSRACSQCLDVIGVGVRRDQELALGELEVEVADQFDHLVERVLLPDVDEGPFRAAVDEVDVHPERPARPGGSARSRRGTGISARSSRVPPARVVHLKPA